jgi:RES domain
VSSGARRPSRVPPSFPPPAPPDNAADLDPLLETWEDGRKLHRCYDIGWGSRDFYAGDYAHRGRFHPFTPDSGTEPLPVLYGASDFDGAVYETVFHDVPIRGIKRVPHAKLLHRVVVALTPKRDLKLVDLTSDGLRRLELTRGQLIDSDARSYADTAAWAQALHAHPHNVDGLLWVSRQHDTSRALVLFGDRVKVDDLEVAPEVPLTLGAGPGLEAVSAAASRAGITITGLA